MCPCTTRLQYACILPPPHHTTYTLFVSAPLADAAWSELTGLYDVKASVPSWLLPSLVLAKISRR